MDESQQQVGQQNRRHENSGVSGVTLGAEAGQGLIFVVEGGDHVQETKGVERQQGTAGRPYKSQVATLVAKTGVYLNEDAETGAINVTQSGEIQQQPAGPAGDQFFQLGSQQLALTVADGRPSPEVQDDDVAGFTD